MLVLKDVPSNGTEIVVTLHGDIEVPTHPKTELTRLMGRVHKLYHTKRISAALGIETVNVHLLRNGSKSCDIEEVKRLLKKGGIDYE